eukprot:5944535-Pyramimonas_sp.AAC.1
MYKIGGFVSSALSGHVIGGDFNMEPQVLGESKFVETLEAQLVASGGPTCTSTSEAGSKNYDYFIVSSGLSKGVRSVGVDRSAPPCPLMPLSRSSSTHNCVSSRCWLSGSFLPCRLSRLRGPARVRRAGRLRK